MRNLRAIHQNTAVGPVGTVTIRPGRQHVTIRIVDEGVLRKNAQVTHRVRPTPGGPFNWMKGRRIPIDASPFRNVFSKPSIGRFIVMLPSPGLSCADPVVVAVIEVHSIGRSRAVVVDDRDAAVTARHRDQHLLRRRHRNITKHRNRNNHADRRPPRVWIGYEANFLSGADLSSHESSGEEVLAVEDRRSRRRRLR